MQNRNIPDDSNAPTQPCNTQPVHLDDPLAAYQPIRVGVPKRKSLRWLVVLGPLLAALVILGILSGATWLFAPKQTDLLILGIDRPPEGTNTSRSDTIILVRIRNSAPEVTLLSIPRDLWVQIPGVGENRINTAHFFAEAAQPGSGPQAVIDTLAVNLGFKAQYYLRLQFDGFVKIIDAMGGVTIQLEEDMGIYPIGAHKLTAEEALAFARDRKDADDFFRMEHAQVLVRGILAQLIRPSTWPRFPAVWLAFQQSVDTNLPIGQWLRLGALLLRAGPEGISTHSLPREMTTSYITDQGASVLLPRWEIILPFLAKLFP
jgi:LCP family protein required for cell wall assembly